MCDLCNLFARRRKGVIERDCNGESPLSGGLLSEGRLAGEGESQSPTLFLAVVTELREGVEPELLRLLVDAEDDTTLLDAAC